MSPKTIILFLTTFSFSSYVILFIVVLALNFKSRKNKALAFLIFSFAWWAFAQSIVYMSTSAKDATFWDHISFIGAILVPFSTLNFLLEFIEKRFPLKLKLAVFVPIFSFLLYDLYAHQYYILDKKVYYGWAVHILNPVRFNIALIHMMVFPVISIITLILYWKNEKNVLKQKQLKTVVLSYSTSFILGFTSDGIFPALGFDVPSLTPVFTVILAYGLVYAITKYQFMFEEQSAKIFIKSLTKKAVFLENMINSYPEILIITTLTGEIVKYNSIAEKKCDLSSVNNKVFKIQQLIGFENKLEFEEIFLKNKASKQNRHEFLIKNLQGTPFFEAEIRYSILKDEQGNKIGYIFSFLDITEEKKFEEEILESQKKAENSQKMKENIFSNVTHELITPLNSMNGFSSLLLTEDLPQSMLEKIEKINTFSEIQLKKVKDLLEKSKEASEINF